MSEVSNNHEDADHSKRKRSRRVCTECRQQKARCDAQHRFPAPCTRCRNQFPPLICRIDPSYARKRRRERLPLDRPTSAPNECRIEQQPQALPQSPITSQLTASNPARVDPASSVPGVQIHILPTAVDETGGLQRSPRSGANILNSTDFVLGNVRIDAQQAAAFFGVFFAHHHPHLQLFLQRPDITSCYETEPLLFWSIICVASFETFARAHAAVGGPSSSTQTVPPLAVPSFFSPTSYSLLPKDSETIYSRLVTELKPLFAELVVKPPRTHAAVQALLISSEWPFPAVRRRDEVVWTYTQLATQVALQLGLNRPFNSSDYSSRVALTPTSLAGRERTLAWLQCYRLNVEAATRNGLPCCISDDWTISKVSLITTSPQAGPDWLADISLEVLGLVRVQHFVRSVMTTLGSSCDTPSGQSDISATLPITRIFGAQLISLEQQLCSLISVHMRMALLKARLVLLAYKLQIDPARVPGHERVQAILDCYQTSMQVLDLCSPVTELNVWPASAKLGLYMASVCLLRLLTMSDGSFLNKDEILQKLSAMYMQIQAACTVHGDHTNTSSYFMLYLISIIGRPHIRSDAEIVPIQVTSRLGWANWLFELIGLAKCARGAHHPPVSDEWHGTTLRSETASGQGFMTTGGEFDHGNVFTDMTSSLPDFSALDWQHLFSFLEGSE